MAVDNCTKRCTKCTQEKPKEQFSKSSVTKDSLHQYCKECARLVAKQWRAANRDRHRASSKACAERYKLTNSVSPNIPAEKRCARCGQIKCSDLFRRFDQSKDGLFTWCINCCRAKDKARDKDRRNKNARAYSSRNKDAINARQRNFYRNNKELFFAHNRNRKARIQGSAGSHTKQQIAVLYSAQKERCAYCAMRLHGKYHVDHRMPLALGGSNDITNLQILCPTCNLRKNKKHPIEFANQIGLLL